MLDDEEDEGGGVGETGRTILKTEGWQSGEGKKNVRMSKKLDLNRAHCAAPLARDRKVCSPAASLMQKNVSTTKDADFVAKKTNSWKMTAEKCEVIETFDPDTSAAATIESRKSLVGSKDLGKYLPLRIGDIVTVIAQNEDGWWAGVLDERVGRFPSKCVKLLPQTDTSNRKGSGLSMSLKSSGWPSMGEGVGFGSLPDPTEKPKVPPRSREQTQVSSDSIERGEDGVGFKRYCTAKWNFMAEKEGDLNFVTGDVIEIIEKRPDSWWKGKLKDGAVGIFPANFVTEDVDEEDEGQDEEDGWIIPGSSFCMRLDQKGMENQRTRLLNDIIKEEWEYILVLQNIVEVFMDPLEVSGIVPHQHAMAMFMNLPLIISVNREFYNCLTRRVKRYSTINTQGPYPVGDVFDRMADYFKMYSIYCANLWNAFETKANLERKNQNFRRFLKFCINDPACNGMELEDYLILPCKQIVKYPVYIKGLLESTPKHHEDYPLLESALRKMKGVVSKVEQDEKQRKQMEHIYKIQNLFAHHENLVSPSSMCIKQGVVTIHTPNQKCKLMKVVMYLFTDMILMGKPKKEEFLEEAKRKKNCFGSHIKVPLHQARLIDIFAKEWVNSFEIQHVRPKSKVRCFLVSVETEEEKIGWIAQLKDLIKRYQLERFSSEKNLQAIEEAKNGDDKTGKRKSKSRWERMKGDIRILKMGQEKDKAETAPMKTNDTNNANYSPPEEHAAIMKARSQSVLVVDVHELAFIAELGKTDESPQASPRGEKEKEKGKEKENEKEKEKDEEKLYFTEPGPNWTSMHVGLRSPKSPSALGRQRLGHSAPSRGAQNVQK